MSRVQIDYRAVDARDASWDLTLYQLANGTSEWYVLRREAIEDDGTTHIYEDRIRGHEKARARLALEARRLAAISH